MSRILVKLVAIVRGRLRRGRTLGRRLQLFRPRIGWLLLALFGLAGCSMFNRYERIEISGGTGRLKEDQKPELRPPKTKNLSSESVNKAEKSSDSVKSVDGRPTSRTSFKPVIVTAGGSRRKDSSEIQQVALFQSEDEKEPPDSARQTPDRPATSKSATEKETPGRVKLRSEKPDKNGIKVPDVDNGDSKAADTPTPAGSDIKIDDPGIAIQSPDGAVGLTLDQTINLCLLNDPVIRAGLESINVANGEALTASLKPNPVLFNDIQLLPLTRPFTPTKQGGPPQLDAIVTYPIDWFVFGKRAAAMQSTNLAVRVSESEYEDLIRTRVLEAATAFYGVLEARALRDVARQDTENFRQIEARTAVAVENGGRPRVELNRIQLDRLRSEQFLRDADNALVSALARLRVVLGRDDSGTELDVIGTLESDSLMEPLPIDEAVDIADQNRPDLEAARWRIAQADAQVEVERRKGYPTLTPGFGYTKQYQTKATGFPDADSWMAQLTMSIPIFDRNQGNQVKACALAAQAGYQLQVRRVALRGEVVQATQELTTAAMNARAVAQDQLQIAQQVRESINAAYEAGGRPLIDALDAQRNYRETYRLFITSRANYARAEIKYSAVLGRKMTP